MRIFITGAGGFIGQNLLQKLNECYIECIACVRREITNNMVRGNYITYVICDIYDYSSLLKFSKGCDSFIHLAGITSYYDIQKNPNMAFENSIQGITNVLKVCNENSIQKLYFTSSGKVYKPCYKLIKISENYPTKPSTLMGKFKLEIEKILKVYSEINISKSIIILRIFNVFGNGQGDKFLLPRLIRSSENTPVYLCNDMSSRDYIYINDVIHIIQTLLKKKNSGFEVYNIGSGRSMRVDEIINIVEKIYKKKIKFIYSDLENRMEGKYECADISKIIKIGCLPKYNFEEALLNMKKSN